MPAQGGIVSSTSGSRERSSGRTILAVVFGIIAVIGVVVAVIYLAEPAKSLPSFIPGHIAGSSGHHPLKATGSFVLGVIFAVAAWFALVYKQKPQAAAPSDRESSPAGRS
jgi:preprotein translocase subunit SecY